MNLTAYAALLIDNKQSYEAIPILKNAVNIQQLFKYIEPEHHYLPIQQCLAALYLSLGNQENKSYYLTLAAIEYTKALVEHPYNVWSLIGLKLAKISLQKYIITSKNDINPLNNHNLYNIFDENKWNNLKINEINDFIAQYWHYDENKQLPNGSCCELGFC